MVASDGAPGEVMSSITQGRESILWDNDFVFESVFENFSSAVEKRTAWQQGLHCGRPVD